MSCYLIGYIDSSNNNGHEDPALEEFTYGDVKVSGKRLQALSKGDYLFFHRTIRGRRYITAYYVVESAMSTRKAKNNRNIMLKYKNPHLFSKDNALEDTIVFGNPIESNILKRPLELTKELLNNLSRRPNFNPNQTNLAAISSALRVWKELNKSDVDYLLEEIKKNQGKSFLKETYLSTQEIQEIDEIDVEKFISLNPESLGSGLVLFEKQLVLDENNRLDLLLKNPKSGELVVVEIKKGQLGREVYKQISNYIKLVKAQFDTQNVRGVIVGSDVLAAYEEFYFDKVQSSDISVFLYAWKFTLRNYFEG